MKKYNFYLWLFALIGMITSCSQDEAAGPQSTDNHRVSLSAGIDRGAQTRATTSSVTIKPGYKLRYVLEVWDTKTPSNLVHRNETTATDASAVNFDFELTTAGDYKALLWADFVLDTESGSPVTTPNNYTHYADCFYKTTDNLKTITLAKTGTNYTINAQPRDAYFACADIKKETGAFSKSVQLTRPFGHINIIEKTTALLAKVASLTATYRVPQGFDVSTGQPAGTTVEVTPTVTQLATPENNGAQANLFSDYIFAPQDNQTTLGEIKLTFTCNDATLLLDDFTIPANMPVKRNKRTNISGSILNTSAVPSDVAKLSVSVSDMWSGTSEDINLDAWDGAYPTTIAQAKEWMGEESEGAAELDGRNHIFTITAARQLAALHYLTTNRVAMANATSYTNYSDATYKLAADIDLNNKPWVPLGMKSTMVRFDGIFDGQGHTIEGMNITGNYSTCGLFVHVGGVVKHLNVKGTVAPAFTTNFMEAFCGGIVGRVYGTNACIAFCSFEGTIAATSDYPVYAGGIAGLIGLSTNPGQIVSCYSVVTDMDLKGTGAHIKGGIAAEGNNSATLKGCYWKTLTGVSAVLGSGTPVEENNDSFEDAPGLNAVIGTMNSDAYLANYDYKWQAGTGGSYPVLVPKP